MKKIKLKFVKKKSFKNQPRKKIISKKKKLEKLPKERKQLKKLQLVKL